jgi:hypothetical protein
MKAPHSEWPRIAAWALHFGETAASGARWQGNASGEEAEAEGEPRAFSRKASGAALARPPPVGMGSIGLK